MENCKNSHSCMSRRSFIGNCSASAAGFLMAPSLGLSVNPRLFSTGERSMPKTRIKVIYAHPDPTRPNWPNIGYDFAGYIEERKKLLGQKCPHIEFSSVTVDTGAKEKGEEIVRNSEDYDGYVVYLTGCLWGQLTEAIGSSGKPTVVVDNLFAGSGEFLTSYANLKRNGHKVVGVSSSNFDDVAEAVNCIDAISKLGKSRILVVGRDPDQGVTETYGTAVQKVEFDEINKVYEKINREDARKVADEWITRADRVIEPSREDVDKAAAMYLAMASFMDQYNAQAITINCLGGIYSGKMIDAYPCLGFMQLDNEGMVGACEADQRSTVTKVLMTYLAGQPGFISDPVIDTARNRIIYAHCMATTKVYGPAGPSNPYHIRDHSEDRKGACPRSLMPLNRMTTTIQFDHNKKQAILHQGKSVENVDVDKACRTKLAVEVKGDVYKLMEQWDRWGWHRVTYYGDHKRLLYNAASLMGFEVLEEA